MSSNPPSVIPGLGYLNQSNWSGGSSNHPKNVDDMDIEDSAGANGGVDAGSSGTKVDSFQEFTEGHHPKSSGFGPWAASTSTFSGPPSLVAPTSGKNKTDALPKFGVTADAKEFSFARPASKLGGPSGIKNDSSQMTIDRPFPTTGGFGHGAPSTSTFASPALLLPPSGGQNKIGALPRFGVTAYTKFSSARPEPYLGFAQFATTKAGEDRRAHGGTLDTSGNGPTTGFGGGTTVASSASAVGPSTSNHQQSVVSERLQNGSTTALASTKPAGASIGQGGPSIPSGTGTTQGVHVGGGAPKAQNTSSFNSGGLPQSGEHGNKVSTSNVAGTQLVFNGYDSSSGEDPGRVSTPSTSSERSDTRMDLSDSTFPGGYKFAWLDISNIHPEACIFCFGVLAIQANLAPRFEYSGGRGSLWAVKLTFWGNTLVKQELSDSKLAAKMGVCRQALQALKPQFESWTVPDLPTKESTSTSWNWPHVLEKYCVQAGIDDPVYTKYVNANGYRFEVEVSGGSYFGLPKFYRSEVEAKNASAHIGLYYILVHNTEDTTVFPGASFIRAGFANNWDEYEHEPRVPSAHMENQGMVRMDDVRNTTAMVLFNSTSIVPSEPNILGTVANDAQRPAAPPSGQGDNQPSGNQVSNDTQRPTAPPSGQGDNQPSGNQISNGTQRSTALPLGRGDNHQVTTDVLRPTAPPSGRGDNQPSGIQVANGAQHPAAPPSGPRANQLTHSQRAWRRIQRRRSQGPAGPQPLPNAPGASRVTKNKNKKNKGNNGNGRNSVSTDNPSGKRWNVSANILRFQTVNCTSHKNRVAVICGLLALQDPEYNLDLFNRGFGAPEYHAAAFFPTDPFLSRVGPIGKISYTHGQRIQAGEECAREVANYLIEMVEKGSQNDNAGGDVRIKSEPGLT